MDSIRALIYFVIGFLLAITAGLAMASITATSTYTATSTHSTAIKGTGSTKTQACNNLHYKDNKTTYCAQYPNAEYYWIYQINSASETTCQYTAASKYCQGDGVTYWYHSGNGQYSGPTYTCPSNSTLSGTSCTCNTGYNEVNGACELPQCPTGQVLVGTSCQDECPSAGDVPGVSGSWYELSTTTYNASLATVCLGGCTFKVTTSSNVPTTGGYMAAQIGTQTGQECNPVAGQGATPDTIPEPELSPEGQCVAKGMSYGEVNGQVVCVAKSDSPTSTTTTTNTTDASGNITTKQTTTNPDGTVSQTTTTKDSTGAVTSTVTNTYTTTSDFCAANPDLTICANSTAGDAENCTTAPACSGDAIQCAILREQWKTRCANTLDATDTNVTAGQTAISADGSTLTQLGVTNDTVNIAGQIEQTAFLGAGCVADQSVSLGQYGSFTIPFSSLCSTFNILGNILVALAFIGAARITTII